MTKKTKTPKPSRPVVVIVKDSCPHCGSASGYLKSRGSHREHLCQATGTLTRWFYVDCKECEGRFLLAEKTLLTPESDS